MRFAIARKTKTNLGEAGWELVWENVEINDNNVILMHVATTSLDAFLTDDDDDDDDYEDDDGSDRDSQSCGGSYKCKFQIFFFVLLTAVAADDK